MSPTSYNFCVSSLLRIEHPPQWKRGQQQSSTRTELVSGFKEIRIDSIPFIIEMFPGAYHIVNYQKNHSAQLQSQFHRQSRDIYLVQREAMMKKYLREQNVFELALEDFSVERFNSILKWIGITPYQYSDVLHSNNKGYNSDTSTRVCKTNCSCSI